MTFETVISSRSPYSLAARSRTRQDYDYYVDSVNGLDTNSGRSINAPLKTLAALPTITAYMRIALAKGSTWRETLTIPAAHVTVNAYGTGAAPIIDGTDVIAAGEWSKSGGYTNIYQISSTLDFNASHPCFQQVYVDGLPIARATSLANLDATANRYYVSSDTSTTPTVYIHITGDGNPAGDGHTYEVTRRTYALSAYGIQFVTVNGIQTQRTAGNNGSTIVGRYSSLSNCIFNWGGRHNVLVSDGCTLTDCVSRYAYYNNTSTLYVHNEATPAGLGVTYTRCIAEMQLAAVAPITSGANSFYGHVNTSGSFGTVTYTDCQSISCDLGYAGQNAVYTMTGCTSSGTAIYGSSWTSETVSMTNCTITGVQRAVSVGGDNCNITITNSNISATSPSLTRHAIDLQGRTGTTLTVSGGTITTAQPAGAAAINSTAAGNTISVSNCTIKSTGASAGYIYIMSGGATLASDYNTITRASPVWNLGGTVYSGLANWQAAGYDTHST